MAKQKPNRKKRQNVLKTPSRIGGIVSRIFWFCYDLAFIVFFFGLIAMAIYAYSVTDELIEKFEGRRWKIAGHVYSDSITLLPGLNIKTANLTGRLVRRNYQQTSNELPRQGEFIPGTDNYDIYLRDFAYPWEKVQGYWLRLYLKDGRIESVYNMTERRLIHSAELEPELIGRFFGTDREERDLVTYDEVSPYLINAIVAVEDNAFFRHHGLNIKGLIRMVLVNLRHMKLVQGGSSITQQLVKNFYLSSERTVRRKVKEAIMALVLERLYTKEEIFECYLNEVYFGQSGSVSICGVGEASKFYFGKNVRNLNLAESALLAGLLRSPEGYNPRKRVERAKVRRDYILDRMDSSGLITNDQAAAAKREKIKVQHHTPSYTIAPYFIEFLKRQLAEKYSSEVLVSEGLNVFTTLDVEMQRKAEKALKDSIAHLEKNYKHLTSDPEKKLQAAIIVLEPQTGYIRAMVGGRSFADSQYNRAVQSKRQTGSVFKPFVYSTGFVLASKGKLNFKSSDIIIDEPFSIKVGKTTYRPHNYSKKYSGPLTIRKALEKSINVPAVKVAMKVGINNIIEVAHKMGITTKLPPYPSLALGSADLTLLEVASAYSSLAALGSHAEPISMRDVVDKDNQRLDKKTIRVKRAIPAEAAYLMVNLMKGVLDRGTGVRARSTGFVAPAAGKTGTTDNYRDGWFVGFTPNLLCAVWVGFDKDKNVGLAGGSVALPIWTQFMKSQFAGSYSPDWEPPDSIEFHKIDYDNGKLAVYGCPKIIEEAFIKGQEPEEECTEHKDSIVEFFKKKVGGLK